MEEPNLIRHGLCREFESGFNSSAIDMLYEHVKKNSNEISKMIRETWNYIKEENTSNHIICHFLYLLECEVDREWVKDISFDIVKYGLNYDDIEIVDRAIGLAGTWNDKDILDLLYNTEIKEEWLQEYKIDVLNDFGYFK